LAPVVSVTPVCVGDGMSSGGHIECVGTCPDKVEQGVRGSGTCKGIEKEKDGKKYEYCGCEWAYSSAGESACCHLIVWLAHTVQGDDGESIEVPAAPDVRGDCVSCPLTGVCTLQASNTAACVN
jgi:hypothetical protein